jgi:hypothetical protein
MLVVTVVGCLFVGCGAARSSSDAGIAAPGAALDPEIRQALTTTSSDRVNDTARPGPGVPILSLIGPSMVVIEPGGSATLRAQSAPRALVHFYAKDGGIFPNQRASITVLADDQGVATTTLAANPGTIDDTTIFIGSPRASGMVSMIVHILHPGSIHLTPSATASTIADPGKNHP